VLQQIKSLDPEDPQVSMKSARSKEGELVNVDQVVREPHLLVSRKLQWQSNVLSVKRFDSFHQA
jgi:hypothetical protein